MKHWAFFKGITWANLLLSLSFVICLFATAESAYAQDSLDAPKTFFLGGDLLFIVPLKGAASQLVNTSVDRQLHLLAPVSVGVLVAAQYRLSIFKGLDAVFHGGYARYITHDNEPLGVAPILGGIRFRLFAARWFNPFLKGLAGLSYYHFRKSHAVGVSAGIGAGVSMNFEVVDFDIGANYTLLKVPDIISIMVTAGVRYGIF